MSCSLYQFDDSSVLVGDPVDVISGANVDRTLDFQFTGPIRLLWVRYYDSSQHRCHYALGWGHTHDFDRWLRFDVDGIRYTGVLGRTIGFPPLKNDGQRFARAGYVLHRVTPSLYRVYQPAEPTMEFEFRNQSVAPLAGLTRGRSSIRLSYDDRNRLQGIRDSLGRAICVTTDDAGRILTLTLEGPAGNPGRPLLAYKYDDAGNLVRGEDPYRNSFRFRYDQNNRMTVRTDRRGYSFLFEYDKQGRCTRSTGEDGLHETHLQYHALEKITVVTKADGGQWTYLYPTGRLTHIIDPYGGTQELKRDESGRVIEEVDPNGNVTRRVYDSRGALVRKVSPLNQLLPVPDDRRRLRPNERALPSRPIEWEYGNVHRRLRPGEPISPPRPSDVASSGLPDRVKQQIRTCDPGFTKRDGAAIAPLRPSRRVYDDFGHLVKERGPNGTSRRWLYDPSGNVSRITDRDGHQYSYQHASWDLRTAVVNPLGYAITFQYTKTQKLAAMIDTRGALSGYEHDLKDRLVRVRRHGVVKEQYRYDQADNLIEKLDGNGNPLISIEVGPGNLKKYRRLASGQTHSYGYDENGRLLRAATDTAEVLFAYDKQGHRIREERNGLGITHRYGANGFETTYFKRFKIIYKDLGGAKLSIVDPRGLTHTIKALGRGLLVRTIANGSSEVAQFDESGRCLIKATIRRRADMWLRNYSYSGEGDLLSVADNIRGPAQYTYDPAHHLVRAELPGVKAQVFEHDSAGNLLRQPGLDDVLISEGNRLGAANGDSFEHNERNHISSRVGHAGLTSYVYDSADMLTSVRTPDLCWEAEYDALGRRISKRTGEMKTEFYWDKERLMAELRVDGSVRLYVYADDFAMTPFMFLDYISLEAALETGKGYYVHCDHLGTPLLVEDDSGRTAWTARIDPYGFAHVDAGSTTELFLRFPGHYFDPEIGLHCNGFRYYSPELGRYLQSDPVGIRGGPNLYAYTANPLKRVDVLGLCPDAAENAPQTITDPSDEREGTDENEEEPETLWEAMARGAPLNEDEDEEDTSRGQFPFEQEEDERLQNAADAIHQALEDDIAEARRTTTVTKGDDSGDEKHTVTSSSPLTANQKEVARDLLGDDVRLDDAPPQGPQADHSNHGEQCGIAATDGQTNRVAASSSGAGHRGAACVQCQKAMDDAGVRNATGSQPQPSGEGTGRSTGDYGGPFDDED